MRCYARPITIAAWLMLLALTGCTLIDSSPAAAPVVITATLSEPVAQALTPTRTPAITPSPLPSPTPARTPTPAATLITLIPPTSAAIATSTPASLVSPTPLPTLAPTRTVPAAASASQPLDDGSGRPITGTGNNSPAAATGTITLPESLYFLAPDMGGANQVFRLRVGFTAPDQVTLSQTGVSAYDLAPNGTLAYITPAGLLLASGVPVSPSTDQTTLPQATALAWSPLGGWLALTLQTPGAESTTGPHPVDGLWLRSEDGSMVRLAASDYSPDAPRVFTGSLRWRPDGAALLAAHTGATGPRWSVITIANTTVIPLWNDSTLPPDTFTDAYWSLDGTTVIGSGAGHLLSITPSPLSAQIILDSRAGYAPAAAQPRADGSLAFIGQHDGGLLQLYALLPGQNEPVALSDSLTAASTSGPIEALWDSSGTQAIIVLADSPGTALVPALGSAFLRDTGSIRHDLAPLTGGPIAAPQWAPIFKPGDRARVQSGEVLNLRSTPDGAALSSLVSGLVVTVRDGPQTISGVSWWQVQTSDGLTGWVIDSVRDSQGQVIRTLLPTN